MPTKSKAQQIAMLLAAMAQRMGDEGFIKPLF